MTFQDAIKDAEAYAEITHGTVYVYRRGNAYKASQHKDMAGWSVAAICVAPTQEAKLLAVPSIRQFLKER